MIPVIIPFYKNKDQLEKCLQHLKHQTMSVDLFIRDNTHDNIFFTAAINEGLRHFLPSRATYILLLNQDMYLAPHAVDEMVNFMNRNPRCGIGAPLQLHPQQKDYVIWAGSYEAFPVGRHQHGPLHQFRTDEPIFWANGACMILRREMVEEIGFLDKRMVFIGSDSDYSLTAKSRGWEVWRIASAAGVHEHGASGVSNNPHIELLKVRDMLRFAQKWLTGDRYRELTYEGKNLTTGKISEIVLNLLQAEKNIQASIQANHLQPEENQACVSH